MSNEEFHTKRQSAIYTTVATFLLLLSRSLTNDYELSQAFIAINHLLVFVIIFLYMKSLSLVSRLYNRPLKKDPLRICVWICFGMNILMTVMQFVAEKAILDSKAVAIVAILTSLPVSIGIYCFYTRKASNKSKLKLHCIIGFGVSMVYLVFRLAFTVLSYAGVSENSIIMVVFSKSVSISLLLYVYVFIMSLVYYCIAKERENSLSKKLNKGEILNNEKDR